MRAEKDAHPGSCGDMDPGYIWGAHTDTPQNDESLYVKVVGGTWQKHPGV